MVLSLFPRGPEDSGPRCHVPGHGGLLKGQFFMVNRDCVTIGSKGAF